MGDGATRRGVIELQPGSATAHINENSNGTSTGTCNGISSFSIGLGTFGDATPVFRFTLTVKKVSPSPLKGRIVGEGLKNLTLASPFTASAAAGGARGQAHEKGIVRVSYCTRDGTRRSVANVPSFHCPFDSCGMRCRDFTALQQHLSASHLYFEYFFQDTDTDKSADGQGKPPEIFVRYKTEWFRKDGRFLPWECSPATVSKHPLVNLLHKSPIWLVFEYKCPRRKRWLRYATHALGPSDTRDMALELKALKVYEQEAAEAPQEVLGRNLRVQSEPSSLDVSDVERAVQGRGRGGDSADRAGLGEGRRGRGGQGGVQSRGRGNRGRLASGPVQQRRRTVGISLLTPDGRPKFYHARSCMAMSALELQGGDDSDDETDIEEWKVRYI